MKQATPDGPSSPMHPPPLHGRALRLLLGPGFAGVLALAGCTSRPEPDPVRAPGPLLPPSELTAPALWSQTVAVYRGHAGARVVYACLPNPDRAAVGAVWGTDVYHDESALCAAAVHAGVFTFEQGGHVLVDVLPGQMAYAASTRNGVTTDARGAGAGSFRVSPSPGLGGTP